MQLTVELGNIERRVVAKIKTGARVARQARAITFHLAEVAAGPMVRDILAAIRRLRAPPQCS